MKHTWLLPLYAFLGTVISGYLTYDLAFLVLDNQIVSIGIAIILDLAFWVWDISLPMSKSNDQRLVSTVGMVVFFLAMAATSVVNGIYRLNEAGLSGLEGWGVVILALAGNIGVGLYTAHRFTDPEMRQRLLEMEEDILDREAELTHYRQGRQNIRGKLSLAMAQKKLEDEYIQKFGELPPTLSGSENPKV